MAYFKSKNDNAVQTPPVHIGQFSPPAHSTAADGSDYIDLSTHDQMLTNYTDYVTESGYTVTIVKSGFYHFNCRTLAQCDAGADVNLYVYCTLSGFDQVNFRVGDTSGSDIWHSAVVDFAVQLIPGNTVYQAVNNSAKGSYHHHGGPSWTRLSIDYLGEGDPNWTN